MKKLYSVFKQLLVVSIRRQLILGMVVVQAVLMSVFVYGLVERQQDFLHQQSIDKAKALATILAVNSISSVLANDVVGLEEILQAQKNYTGLHYAMVLNTNGKVLGHTEIDKVGLYLNDSISLGLLKSNKENNFLVENHNYIDVASAIKSNGKTIAWARVNLSLKDNLNNLQTLSRNGFIYTLLAICIGALFAFYMSKNLSKGLLDIVRVAEGIKGGDAKLRVNVTRSDELGKLGEDFNTMLDTIDKSKRDLQDIMDNSPAVIYVKDIKGRFTFINKQFEKVFHFTQKNIVGKTLHDIFPQQIADEMKNNDNDVLETGRALESEELAPQDDVAHTYRTVKFPLFDDNENIYAICGISTDMTDSINMTKDKAALETQLFHTQKMQAIGQLTGGVAHDFNNLLAVILGYAELSMSMFGKNNESLTKYLKEIETAGIRGRDLIKQMMIYSRKDQSDNDIELVKIDTILNETVSMLKATFPSGIVIKTSIAENLPHVKGSSSLISQVLMNLCINAKDGMSNEGELDVKLSVESFSNEICQACHETYSGDYVTINIKDNGEGIPEEIITRIFEPFFTSKKVGEGTGMGLSVVHGAVHKLNGHILVESTVGVGTSFKILFPVSNETALPEVENKQEKPQYDFSDLHVLIVDDELAVAALLEASLENVKAKVTVFTDSEQALAYFAENSGVIDLVITDQTMPNLSGIELCEKLLALRADTKIILCTGHSADVTEKSAIELGVKRFIHKPIKILDLYNKINELK